MLNAEWLGHHSVDSLGGGGVESGNEWRLGTAALRCGAW
jgi:hypothetical protein